MKVLYSQIKELVPELTVGPLEVGEALTLTGFMMDGFEKVKYKGVEDYLLSFEIRQNRADCLSVIGLAREAAAYFGLKIVVPKVAPIEESGKPLDIQVEAKDEVKRVMAVKLDGAKNGQSPAWLKEYVAFYGLNSVNILVDLSNYVMLFTGYPSHLIDFKKTSGHLAWSLNRDFDEVTTLFGTAVKLQKDKEIIIQDGKNVVALAGIVGGQAAAIDEQTDSFIAEVAIYDRSVIRKNSRSLNVVTEASHRLEKDIDPNGAEYALNLLVSLIIEYAGAHTASAIFSYYPKKQIAPVIAFEPSWAGKFAGIEIPQESVAKIFEKLEFKIEKENKQWLVTPPTVRMDLALPEDLVEEAVRIYGYDKIPTKEIPNLEIVSDITPKNIIVEEKIRDILASLGFDEILSWPLTEKGGNTKVNYVDWKEISTQNSVNDLFPNLRQSIATGLLSQLREYEKNNVEFIDIFEIGKIFGEKDGRYLEHGALGIMSGGKVKSLSYFKNRIESLLRLIGFEFVSFFDAKSKPEIANPGSCWEIQADGKSVGIIYKLIPDESKLNTYFAELDIAQMTELLTKDKNNPVVEITQKLIALDANIELPAEESIYEYLEKLKKTLDKKHIWSVNVADTYPLGAKTRYTVRVTYQELSDQEAKKIHLATFNL